MADAPLGNGRIDDRICDRPVPHEGLQGTGIDATARQRIASRVPQHVGMDGEWQPSSLAKPLYKLLSAVD